jgi:hypothetical protein
VIERSVAPGAIGTEPGVVDAGEIGHLPVPGGDFVAMELVEMVVADGS